jgi:LysM repeat protein/lysozyme family protein
MSKTSIKDKPTTIQAEDKTSLVGSFFSSKLAAIGVALCTLSGSEDALATQLKSRLDNQPSPLTETHKSKIAYYKVQKGDTLSHISQRFKVTVKDIRAANPGLEPDKLRIGQTLQLPNLDKSFHIVSSGEAFWTIAKQYNTTASDLQNANPGVDPKKLDIGQAIAVPSGKTQTALPRTQTPTHSSINLSLPLSSSPSYYFTSPPTFYASMIRAFSFEGGLTRNKNDAAHKNGIPVTNLGITGACLKDHIFVTEGRVASNAELTKKIEELTTEEAIKIYASGFWKKEFAALGNRLSFLIFDWGLTSHPVSVIKRFQQTLNTPTTGIIDQNTINSVKNLGEAKACELLHNCRKDFYTRLAQKRPSDQQFLKGWLSRSDAAFNYIYSDRFQKLINVFEQTQHKGCNIFDPVEQGVIILKKHCQEPALIRVLQERLSKAGWTVKVDGKFGPEMERVVLAFKEHYGLPNSAHWGKEESLVLKALKDS